LTRASPRSMDAPAGGRMRLTRELLSPYRGWIVIILLAMLAETAMSLAAPWPLKVILDNVLGPTRRPSGSLLFVVLCWAGTKWNLRSWRASRQ
jgi:ABC-type bacteriocin/lantibiotic exporter with double-glycine peptidase domain